MLGKGRKDGDTYSHSVLPSFVKKDSVLGNINDNFNCFLLDSKYLGRLTFIGQGAGSLPTASNVIRDVLSLEDPYKTDTEGEGKTDKTKDKRVFYIRTNKEISDEYISEKIDEGTYISKPVCLEVLQSLVEEKDFVGEIDL